MPETYAKVFTSLLGSTVWVGSPAPQKLVWVTLLIKADRHGEIFASVPGLAKEAEVELDECREAVELLLAPDPDSRTPDHEGRRIEVIDGGWRILNHAKYRSMSSLEDRREKDRVRQRRYQERRNAEKRGETAENREDNVRSLHADADAEADAETPSKKTPPSPPRGEKFSWAKEIQGHPLLDNPKVIKRVGELVTYRRESKLRPWKPVTWKKNLEEWSSWGDPALVLEAIDNSIRNGWQSVNYPKGDRRDGSKPEFTPRKKRCKVV